MLLFQNFGWTRVNVFCSYSISAGFIKNTSEGNAYIAVLYVGVVSALARRWNAKQFNNYMLYFKELCTGLLGQREFVVVFRFRVVVVSCTAVFGGAIILDFQGIQSSGSFLNCVFY